MATTHSVAATFEHILVPIDFSDASERAFAYAKTLAKQTNAEFLLAYVEPPVNPPTPPEGAWIDQSELQAMHEAKLEQRGASLVSEGYRATTIFVAGFLYDELLCIIKKNNIDLVVLGTHGRKGLGGLLMGSDAEAMLRRGRSPVLSVGPGVPELDEKVWRIRRIICATTFDPKSAEVAAYAYKLGEQFRAELTFLHVKRPADHQILNWSEFEEAFRKHVPEATDTHSLRTCLLQIATADSIADFAKQRNADLIVMGEAPAAAITTHFPPGTVEKVLMEVSCPVITLLHD
jgi:nucleotide-binding universal stress UspA family protein